MIWLVTTKKEIFRLCNDRHVKDFGSAFGKGQVRVIIYKRINDLFCIKAGDVIVSRTKDKQLVEMLEAMPCNFVGEHHETLSFDEDKQKLKTLLKSKGIKTPKTYSLLGAVVSSILTKGQYFVKPKCLGDSIGIDDYSLCYNPKEILRKCKMLDDHYGSERIIEEFLSGKEYTVAVFSTESGIKSFAVEIKYGKKYLDFAEKQKDNETYSLCLDKSIEELAVKTFNAVKARGYCRVDIRKDEKGTPKVLEINMCPGLGSNGYLWRCVEMNSNLTYEKMIKMIVFQDTSK